MIVVGDDDDAVAFVVALVYLPRPKKFNDNIFAPITNIIGRGGGGQVASTLTFIYHDLSSNLVEICNIYFIKIDCKEPLRGLI